MASLHPCICMIVTADIEVHGERFAVMNQANRILPSLESRLDVSVQA